MKTWLNTTRLYLGIESTSTTHLEKTISSISALIGLYLVYINAEWAFGQELIGNIVPQLVISSMGASAVLLFALPHGVLSQPWAVLGCTGLYWAVLGCTGLYWADIYYQPL